MIIIDVHLCRNGVNVNGYFPYSQMMTLSRGEGTLKESAKIISKAFLKSLLSDSLRVRLKHKLYLVDQAPSSSCVEFCL